MIKFGRVIINILMAIIFLFAIFMIVTSFYDLVFDKGYVTKEVTVIKLVDIKKGTSTKTNEYYMDAIDDYGNYYKVMKWGANKGDKITVYTSNSKAKSDNAEWFSSKSDLRVNKIATLISSFIFLGMAFLMRFFLIRQINRAENNIRR